MANMKSIAVGHGLWCRGEARAAAISGLNWDF